MKFTAAVVALFCSSGMAEPLSERVLRTKSSKSTRSTSSAKSNTDVRKDQRKKLKKQMADNGVAAQALLIPEIVEMTDSEAAQLMAIADDLARLGLTIEPFGGGAIAVRETPALLGEVNATALLRDVLDELTDQGDSAKVQTKIEAILSRVACHGSIRSGRRMRGEEMNALLREMEATPLSGQCNHGRPTYVELKLSDIERLFGRT